MTNDLGLWLVKAAASKRWPYFLFTYKKEYIFLLVGSKNECSWITSKWVKSNERKEREKKENKLGLSRATFEIDFEVKNVGPEENVSPQKNLCPRKNLCPKKI